MREMILVVLLVAVAVLAAGMAIYRSLTGKGGCSGCCLSDRCKTVTGNRKDLPADPDPQSDGDSPQHSPER